MIMSAEVIGGIGVERYTSGHGRKWEIWFQGERVRRWLSQVVQTKLRSRHGPRVR
jgi:hypothetical protein